MFSLAEDIMKKKLNSTSLNVMTSFLGRVAALLSGLVVQRYILLTFGSTYNGLTSLINQVLAYLLLLEAGIGTASVQAFYKPLSEGDWNRVGGILKATDLSYRKSSFLLLAFLVGGAFLIPLSAAGEIDYVVAVLMTMLAGGASFVTYCFSAKYTALLTAERKLYISQIITIGITLLSSFLRVIALKNGCGIISVQAIHLGCICLQAILTVAYIKTRYPQLNHRFAPDFTAIKKRWNVLVHQIAGLIVTNTDILILSFSGSLGLVSIYGVYNLIYGQLGTAVQTVLLHAPQGNFGRLYAEDKKAFYRIYTVYEAACTVLLFFLASLAVLLTLPFIRLYTAGVEDVEYVRYWLPVLFVIIFLFNQVRIPALLTINISGSFSETQKGAIIESIINLSVSLILFCFTGLGMYGLLIGTICSFLYRTADVFRFVYRKILQRSMWRLFRLIGANLVCFGLLFYVFYIVFPVSVSSYSEWLAAAFVLAAIAFVSYFVFNLSFNFHDTAFALKHCMKKLRKHAK